VSKPLFKILSYNLQVVVDNRVGVWRWDVARDKLEMVAPNIRPVWQKLRV